MSRSSVPGNTVVAGAGILMCESYSFAPLGLAQPLLAHPRLAPLRQAQGKLWAAFFRCFAAGSLSDLSAQDCD
jgi:hypothetical protein